MAKRVSAGTITGITSSSDFHDAAKRQPQPDRETLIANIRKSIAAKISMRQQKAASAPDDESASVSLDRAKAELVNFEKSIVDVPDGFELVPVLYSKIPKDVNAGIQSEYLFNVRPQFLTHIATHYAHELQALGVSAPGLARMLKGLDPVDDNGNYYDISIDHIIERSGSGQWSRGREIDPEQPEGATPKYRPNHFGNLIFLPDQIHQYKNRLNEAQDVGSLSPGDTKWILMMTPISDGTRSGYVAAPQKPDSPLFGLRLRADNAQARVNRAVFSIDMAQEALEAFRKNPVVARTLNACESQAYYRQTTVQKIANDNNVLNGMSLRQAFNAAVNGNPAAKQEAEKLRPAVIESKEALRKAYEACAAKPNSPKGRAEIKSLAAFFTGSRVQALRDNVALYPTEEMMDMVSFMDDLETKLTPYLSQPSAAPAAAAPVVASQPKKQNFNGKRR